jgi:cell division protein FtsB
VFGRGGLLELRERFAERAALGEEAFRLINKNDELRQKILRFRRSDRALERLARQELGLVRDDEIVYRFRNRDVEPRAPSTSGADSSPAGGR